jgi:hypothetical protein
MTLDDVVNSAAAVLSVTQTAQLLTDLDGDQVDERTVRRACEDGQLPSIRVGKRILIPRLPLLALLGVAETPQKSEAASTTDAAAAATNQPVEGASENHGNRAALHLI